MSILFFVIDSEMEKGGNRVKTKFEEIIFEGFPDNVKI